MTKPWQVAKDVVGHHLFTALPEATACRKKLQDYCSVDGKTEHMLKKHLRTIVRTVFALFRWTANARRSQNRLTKCPLEAPVAARLVCRGNACVEVYGACGVTVGRISGQVKVAPAAAPDGSGNGPGVGSGDPPGLGGGFYRLDRQRGYINN